MSTAPSTSPNTSPDGLSQLEMVHRLPPATLVDRFEFLSGLAAGRRVVHVGFADTGCAGANTQAGAWLHAHLDRTARALVGIDVDAAGVENARDRGTTRTWSTVGTSTQCARSVSRRPTS